ncbi:MAG: cyclic nucleotide-binding domain-containing protein [Candidatus Gracilibacteria bacterium]|nr:cyclic nucleotide-binding domain-containing protein [Candidatus Gracilibacteria bacterium]
MELQDLYIFEGLSKDELSYFSLIIQNEEYNAGDVILKEGEESDDKAYIIESGEVEIFRGGEKVTDLGVGELFGEIALITHEPRTATVKTKTPTKLLTLYKDDFLMLYEKSGNYEEIKQKILKRIQDNFYGIRN